MSMEKTSIKWFLKWKFKMCFQIIYETTFHNEIFQIQKNKLILTWKLEALVSQERMRLNKSSKYSLLNVCITCREQQKCWYKIKLFEKIEKTVLPIIKINNLCFISNFNSKIKHFFSKHHCHSTIINILTIIISDIK